MYEHNALGYWSGLALCLTKVRSSRARCPATALISCPSYAPIWSYAPLKTKFEYLVCKISQTVFKPEPLYLVYWLGLRR